LSSAKGRPPTYIFIRFRNFGDREEGEKETYFCVAGVGVKYIGEELACACYPCYDQSVDVEAVDHKEVR
jgi:hypothetical protein